MIKILLVCPISASSKLLKKKMEDYALKIGIDTKVHLVSSEEVGLCAKDYDVILVASNVRLELEDVKYVFLHTPVGIIDLKDYALIDAEHILKKALTLYNKKHINLIK